MVARGLFSSTKDEILIRRHRPIRLRVGYHQSPYTRSSILEAISKVFLINVEQKGDNQLAKKLAFVWRDFDIILEDVLSLEGDGFDQHSNKTKLGELKGGITDGIGEDDDTSMVVQFSEYDEIDFGELRMKRSNDWMANAYMIRKALIRKTHLSAIIHSHLSKALSSSQNQSNHLNGSNHSDQSHDLSILLNTSVPQTYPIEISYPDELEELWADELWELGRELENDDDNATTDKENRIENGKKADDDKIDSWWIFKPSMADKGQGLRLFRTKRGLERILEEFDIDSDEEEDDDDDSDKDKIANGENSNGVTKRNGTITTTGAAAATRISLRQMRHFVIQRYITRPLLLRPGPCFPLASPSAPPTNRKFHLRVYVLCVGALKVYVYKQVLALFAEKEWKWPPASKQLVGDSDSDGDEGDDLLDLSSQLTNTCLQPLFGENKNSDGKGGSKSTREGADPDYNVRLFSELAGAQVIPFGEREETRELTSDDIEHAFGTICEVTGQIFKAAVKEGSFHFQVSPNSFELFGLDFVLSTVPLPPFQAARPTNGQGSLPPSSTSSSTFLHPYLLEVNAGPDFAQTGPRLKPTIEGLIEGTMELAVSPALEKMVKKEQEKIPQPEEISALVQEGKMEVKVEGLPTPSEDEEKAGFRKCLEIEVRRGW